MTLVEDLKPDILEVLESDNRTIAELARTLERNYYTVRASLQLLIADNRVEIKGRAGRNAKYGLTNVEQGNEPDVLENTIPRVILNGSFHRLNELITMDRFHKGNNILAAERTPLHVLKLFKVAERLAAGDNTAKISLESIRINMSEDLKSLQNNVEIYKQILGNPRVWDENYLKHWPTDPSYIQAAIDENMERYQ